MSILPKSLPLQVFVLFMSIFVFFYRVCTLLFEPVRFYVIYSGIHHSKVMYWARNYYLLWVA